MSPAESFPRDWDCSPQQIRETNLNSSQRDLTGNTQKGGENIMSEIASLLQTKAGLSPDKAQEVEQVVIQHIMSRVPSEFQGILSSVLGSGTSIADDQPAAAESGGLGGLLSAATSMFGNKG
jgi:hypothetical protein